MHSRRYAGRGAAGFSVLLSLFFSCTIVLYLYCVRGNCIWIISTTTDILGFSRRI
jgi:hypothetical protein